MQIEAALIKEQGVQFAVVVVKPSAVTSANRDRLVRQFSPIWDGVPVVLMAQDGRGRGTFYGRPDLVRFLAKVPIAAMPWRRWTIN